MRTLLRDRRGLRSHKPASQRERANAASLVATNEGLSAQGVLVLATALQSQRSQTAQSYPTSNAACVSVWAWQHGVSKARLKAGPSTCSRASDHPTDKLSFHGRYPNAGRNRGVCLEAQPTHRQQTANTLQPASAPPQQHGTASRSQQTASRKSATLHGLPSATATTLATNASRSHQRARSGQGTRSRKAAGSAKRLDRQGRE
jgi:hypothetical protein